MAAHIATNTVGAVLAYFTQQLENQYGKGEAETFARLALEHVSGIPYSAYPAPGTEVTAEAILQYRDIVAKLLQKQPIQYILGWTEFYGLKINVSPAVLIPRPETEELVDGIITQHKGTVGLNIIDYCTGSGCIALALDKNLPHARVMGIDISEEALAVARQNNEQNAANVLFVKADVLNDEINFAAGDVDIIVSNPPYVPLAELATMAANVKEHEPHLALFVPDDDVLLFYKKITTLAHTQLKPGGHLYFECHMDYSNDVKLFAMAVGYKNCNVIKDMYGKNRFVYAQK